jgi:hypothetical protein
MSSHEQHGFGDRRLMGPVSGFLWLTAAAAAIVCQLLPGTPREHPFIVWGLIALVLVYGVACVRSWIAWERMTLTHHSIAVIAFQPLIALGLWVSGGVDSYLGPILALPTIYVAYFFPPRLALPLGLLEIATFFSPVVYTADAEQHLMLERTVAYAWRPPRPTSAAWPTRTRSPGSRTAARSTGRSMVRWLVRTGLRCC